MRIILIALLAAGATCGQDGSELDSAVFTTITIPTTPASRPVGDLTYAVAYTFCQLDGAGGGVCQPVITEYPTRGEAVEWFYKLRGTIDRTGKYFRYEDFRLLELKSIEP